jgi:hypothetical protein
MSQKHNLFSNMTPVDWLLAAGFTLVLALLGNSLFPRLGWLIGVLVALGLLYLAKRRRDRMQGPPFDGD